MAARQQVLRMEHVRAEAEGVEETVQRKDRSKTDPKRFDPCQGEEQKLTREKRVGGRSFTQRTRNVKGETTIGQLAPVGGDGGAAMAR